MFEAFRLRRVRVLAVVCFAAGVAGSVAAQAPATSGGLTADEITRFLLTARIVRSAPVGKGVTGITRLTLTDGVTTRDAAFQSVDERKLQQEFARGKAEIGFVDSYHYNIAGYQLAVMLGLGHMVPVTVERKWRGKTGSLSWWVDFVFDEGERLKKKLAAPDPARWNQQMYRVRVFSALIHDTDRNLGNMLITDDWTIWMIDFTRAFRRWKAIQHPADLVRCDRRLLEQMEGLTEERVRAATGRHLGPAEIDALMARRDLIVAHFRKLIGERGEAQVLY